MFQTHDKSRVGDKNQIELTNDILKGESKLNQILRFILLSRVRMVFQTRTKSRADQKNWTKLNCGIFKGT